MVGRKRSDSSLERRPETVFLDTSVLLNFIQSDFETDHSSKLFDDGLPAVVVGVTVQEEFEAVGDRRADIYPDFVDFVLENDGRIEEYDPTERRPYFRSNDFRHIQSIQMELAQLESRAEIQRRLRRFVRAIERRIEYLLTEVFPDALFDQQPGLSLVFALQECIENDADARVVADAALWAAEAPGSSGIFLTLDREDILDATPEINASIRDVRDESWELCLLHPTEVNDLPPVPKSPE